MIKNYELKYLNLLCKEFPTIQSVSTEIINLTAILNLPKGTEHFITDIHGEYEAFNHFLKNGSGIIKEKIDLLFSDLDEESKNRLAFFIYYPKQMISKYQKEFTEGEFIDFLRENLLRLIEICRLTSSKYTKSKIRKSLPEEFSYIIQELIFETSENNDKFAYYNSIIDAIFKTMRAKKFIIELCYLIQRLTIDRLHIVGDIYDRGPHAHLVMDLISNYHSVDIEWGNHDILWMGAASGSDICIANALRISFRYYNLDTLEDGYGINLMPLASLATKYYKNDPCKYFIPKSNKTHHTISEDRKKLVAKMHKAITIIQFKLEKALIERNPSFEFENRLLLDKVNLSDNNILINGKKYSILDSFFPTVDPNNPFELNNEEKQVIEHLRLSFLNNEKLQKHVNFLFTNGSMYLKYNENLLFHGCIPLNKDGDFASLKIHNISYKGKDLFEQLEKIIRRAFLNRYNSKNHERDYFVYLWQGENSPLFGKKSMKTFERYFVKEKFTHKEEMNNYFLLRENEDTLNKIFLEFELNTDKSKIINGHVPLDITLGNSPILANNKIYSIDGGMSKSYIEKIRIGGYTLISDSYSIFLVSHERFNSVKDLINKEKDIVSILQSQELNRNRQYIYQTDKGKKLQNQIDELYKLLNSYRSGIIKERKEKP